MIGLNIEKQIHRDINKYNSFLYSISSSKEKYCEKTIGLLQDIARTSGISFVYHGQVVHFIIPETEQRFELVVDPNLEIDEDGAYEIGSLSPSLRVNPNILNRGGYTHKCLVHESIHGFQENIIKAFSCQHEQSLKDQFLLRIRSNIEPIVVSSIFGIELGGRAYVDNTATPVVNILTDLNEAFYRLSITERYAYAAEKKYASKSEQQNLEDK